MKQGDLGRFAGAAVLVTGAAHGIGRACASRLAAEGARVAVADLDQPAAEHVAADLVGEAGRHVAVGLDITDTSSVDQAVADTVAAFGGLDVLVNVAGGDTGHGRFEETPDEVWTRMLELNLLGVVRCCRAAIPHLRRSTKGPAIVNVSSVNGITAFGSEPYSAAKAGISSLTLNLASSLAPDGIRVNTVAPGHDPDPELGRTRGRSRSVPPALSARPRRRARGRRRRRRLPGVSRCGLDHRPHPPRRRRPADGSPTQFALARSRHPRYANPPPPTAKKSTDGELSGHLSGNLTEKSPLVEFSD